MNLNLNVFEGIKRIIDLLSGIYKGFDEQERERKDETEEKELTGCFDTRAF